MGTPNPRFVNAHVEEIIDELKTAIAAQCDCMFSPCPHDRIRELVRSYRVEQQIEPPKDLGDALHEIAGLAGELHGLRSSESFFRNRCERLEGIFEHLKDVWIAAQEWEFHRRATDVKEAGEMTMRLQAAIRTAQNGTPPLLFSPSERLALRAAAAVLGAMIRDPALIPEDRRDGFDESKRRLVHTAVAAIDKIAPYIQGEENRYRNVCFSQQDREDIAALKRFCDQQWALGVVTKPDDVALLRAMKLLWRISPESRS